ncbi:MAG: CPBP family intramembrane glutamic endopeptidase, partial [Cyanobacteria bacterium J06648_10]
SVSTLGVLYWAIKEHLPLSKDWFRINPAGRWPVWGFGGYLVALPLMLGVSLLNQQIWQGQGGNNPILQIVLEERDPVVLGLFLFTAAIAAPIFEEILFRGFLLPSLTRYMSTWTAIGLSSLIFATAHLSFSEVLPLAVLGAILGFVYTKSQNLMSSILLHSTWNSVTMIGLFLLGSGS